MKNPVTRGRMYKVTGGGPVRGIRFNQNGTTDVLVVPGQAKKRNPYFNIGGQTIKAKTMRAALKKALRSQNRRRNVAAGYMDEEGRFHPIRASFDYVAKRAHEGKKRTTKRRTR